MKHTKKTAILGFGNPVRSDDAVGTYVLQTLDKLVASGSYDHLTLLDMGTSAFEVLFQLKGREKLIFVDGVINSGEPVGTIFRVPAEELMQEPEEDSMVFLHSLKWDQALTYAKKIMGSTFPEDITVYLIAIEDTRLEIHLSEEVQKAGDRVVREIIEELALVLPSA